MTKNREVCRNNFVSCGSRAIGSVRRKIKTEEGVCCCSVQRWEEAQGLARLSQCCWFIVCFLCAHNTSICYFVRHQTTHADTVNCSFNHLPWMNVHTFHMCSKLYLLMNIQIISNASENVALSVFQWDFQCFPNLWPSLCSSVSAYWGSMVLEKLRRSRCWQETSQSPAERPF